MSAIGDQVHAEDLDAVPDPVGGDLTWSVWRGRERVGVLEQHGAGGGVWLSGRIDDDLVAEGPTALSVLRRLACRAHARCADPVLPSPVRR